MAVAPNRGHQMSPAVLQSPAMQQASSTCTLHFYYTAYGWGAFCVSVHVHQVETLPNLHFQSLVRPSDVFSDPMQLDVVLRVGPRTTTLWRLDSDSRYERWYLGEVTVGRVPQDFSIQFEASREFTWPGQFAIDDVVFTNCSLPGKPCAQ